MTFVLHRRRAFLGALTTAFCGAVVAWSLAVAPRPSRASEGGPLKIGIIGTGKIGGTLAELWVKSGHAVIVSSRHPDELRGLAQSLGPKARVGTPREAAAFGDVVLVSVPYKALPQVGEELKDVLEGKIVLDTCNPYPERDGDMANDARRKGTGVASAEYLPGVRLVRAFNAISYRNLRSDAHRQDELVGIPIAGDDKQALDVAARLVRDAGFEPVVVGPLSRAKAFDVGTPVYTQILTPKELRAKLGM
ncbi:MAG TPA: NADPH-dependent F420 reductase [Anaeromyxobacteraceae bacterium]